MNKAEFYSDNQLEARRRFRQMAGQITVTANLTAFHVPSKIADDLFVDLLWLEPTGPKPWRSLIVITSGLHGIEAPTGSALQLQFIQETLPSLARNKTGFLIVHCLNPFGFRFGRRNTEGNVNLNRNFGVKPEQFSIENPSFEKMASQLDPRLSSKNGAASLIQSSLLLARLMVQNRLTPAELNQAIAQGQFTHPACLEFGGKKAEPQTEFLISTYRQIFPEFENLILLDLHTGLGDRFEMHLIPGDHPECINQELFKSLVGEPSVQNFYRFTPSESKGFYRTVGDQNSIFPQLANNSQRTLALTVEFGTLGNGPLDKLELFNRVFNENRLAHDRINDEIEKKKIAKRFHELFDPTEEAWRNNAVTRGGKLLQQVARRACGI